MANSEPIQLGPIQLTEEEQQALGLAGAFIFFDSRHPERVRVVGVLLGILNRLKQVEDPPPPPEAPPRDKIFQMGESEFRWMVRALEIVDCSGPSYRTPDVAKALDRLSDASKRMDHATGITRWELNCTAYEYNVLLAFKSLAYKMNDLIDLN